MEHVVHNISPVFDERSEVLILGSFPSVKSREARFFYGHPQNRFWAVMAEVFGWDHVPVSVEEKRAFLLASHVAVWDVIGECDVIGSSDAAIRNERPNDVSVILASSPIRAVFCNGAKAHALYCRHLLPVTGIPATRLPSTSPANAASSFSSLCEAWRAVAR